MKWFIYFSKHIVNALIHPFCPRLIVAQYFLPAISLSNRLLFPLRTLPANPDKMRGPQIAQSLLLLLHAEIVEYNLRGPGARFYDPPEDTKYASAEHLPTVPVPSEPTESGEKVDVVVAAKRRRVEALGQAVGTRLAERYAHDRDMPDQDLDIVKFLCKDFWDVTFRKQIDVLRTNHRGLFVLTDNNFPWLSSIEATPNHPGAPEDYLVFPCGIVSGALTRLGLRCRVTADLFPTSPGFRCSFNVQLIQS